MTRIFLADEPITACELCRESALRHATSSQTVVLTTLDPAASPAPAAPTTAEEPPRPAIIVETLIERCMNSASMLETVLCHFEKQIRKNLGDLQTSIAASDAATTVRIAHSLKGAAATVAAHPLTRIAAEIEKLSREGQITAIDEQLAQLGDEISRCIEYLPNVRAAASERLGTAAGNTEGK